MDLDRAWAEWTLGRFPSRELPELAAQMMVHGFEGPDILELASFHRPAPGDVPPGLVDQAFLSCGRPRLSEEEASLLFVANLLRSEAPPERVLSFVRTHHRFDGPLDELTRLAFDWDEADEPLMRMALEDHVHAVGRRFLLYFGKTRKPGIVSGMR